MTAINRAPLLAWNAANARARMAYDRETKNASGAFIKLGRHSSVQKLPQRSHGRCLFLCEDCDCAECRP